MVLSRSKRQIRPRRTLPDRRYATIPGPRGHFLFGSLLDVQRDPLTFLSNVHRLYGDVVQVRMGPKTVYVVAHPEDVQHVLQENARNYRKGSHYGVLKPIFGNGLMLSEGDFWLRQRRIVQPAFHRQRLGQFGQTMTALTEQMLQRWDVAAERGRPVDAWKEMVKLTLSVVCTTLFGTDISRDAEGIGDAHSFCLQHAEYRIVSPFALPELIPTPENRRYRRSVDLLHGIINRLIDERRESGDDRGDLLSTLAFARYEETGELMDRDQLRDEVITLFLNGHETVSDALGWTFSLLSKHPQVEQRLHQELATVLGGRTPTFEDLARLPYTSWVIQEAMRLFPPAWVIERDALRPDEISGYQIPAKSTVVLSQWVTHRHPEFWENPEGFDPERFSPERSADRHRFAYFPFGGGPRLCVGASFAMMEMVLILATVAQRYHLDLVPGHPVIMEPVITLRPKHGILTTLRRRARPENVSPAAGDGGAVADADGAEAATGSNGAAVAEAEALVSGS